MVTGCGHRLLVGLRVNEPMDQPDISPGFFIVETIHAVTAGDAGFATCATIHVDFERILLAGSRLREWNQGAECPDPFQ